MKHGCTSITAALNTGMHDDRDYPSELSNEGRLRAVEACASEDEATQRPRAGDLLSRFFCLSASTTVST